MMVLQKGDGESVKSLATIQENVKSAAKEVAHTTQEDRGSYKKKVPLNVTVGEAAAARCSRPTEKCSGVMKNARAEHLGRCSLMPGEKENQKKTTERTIY